MADIKADTIGLGTGTYALNCGCRIYVHFPGGHIHLSHGWSQCPELARLWRLYSRACSWSATDPHAWDSLTRYLFCLRHVGAWRGRIERIEAMRSKYPSPAETRDYPATVNLEKKEMNVRVAA
ncbi:hypothetical protein [Streptomyces sp. MMBL 11-1]|uniref:hypothetical protein n=1 Tax=Streptomyces sp. MMBL 11-1 TaxID=3026420 RepID=UPI00236000C6|nr:hypothetical protein [Streptomyces sp. MMBL 11-1]